MTPVTDTKFKSLLVFNLVILALMLIGSLLVWQKIPEGTQIPIRWNSAGQPVTYGSPAFGLLLFPGVMVFYTLLFYFLPQFEPRREHFLKSRKSFKMVGFGTASLFAIVHGLILLGATGWEIDMGRILPFLIGIMFLVIGNYQGKIRSTYTLGIKTPWTLSSELSWNKTHRLAGKLFMLLGALMIVAAMIDVKIFSQLVVAVGVPVYVVWVFAYSYLVWCKDPAADKRN